jgi:hypothetical protein
MSPLFRSLTALVLGWILGSCVAAGLWLLRPPPEAQVLGVSVTVSLNHLACFGVLALAVFVHFALGWVGSVAPSLAAQRALVMAEVGALWGSLGFHRGAGAIQPLGR